MAGSPDRQHGSPVGRLREAVGGTARLQVITLLAAVLALNAADTSAVGATAVGLEDSLHIGNTSIGLLVTVSTFVTAIATLPMGTLTDRTRRIPLLTVAVVVWSVAVALSGASTSFAMLLVTRLALGLMLAAAGPVVASLAGDLFPATERGRLYGFVLSGELIGAGLGFLVAGNIAAVLSWRYAFWLFALLGFGLAFAIRRLPEPARGGQSRLRPGATAIRPAVEGEEDSDPGGPAALADHDEGQVQHQVEDEHIHPREHLVLHEDPTDASLWWAVRCVLSIPTNRVLILGAALGYFFFTGVQTFAVIFVRERFGVGQGLASTLLVIVGAGSVAGVLVSGRVSDGLIARGVLTARPLVAGVSFLLSVALFVPALLIVSLPLTAPLFFLGAAGVGGANPPLEAARLDLMHSRLWGRAEAIRTVLRSSFQASAPLLFGSVSTQLGSKTSGLGHPTGAVSGNGDGLGRTFLIMLAPVALAGVLIIVRGRKTYPRDVATALASERDAGVSHSG